MKKMLWIISLVTFSFLFATTYHVLNFDGTNDFASDETFESSTPDYYHYITWDQDFLYLGISGPNFAGDDSMRVLQTTLWFIDTDPQPNPLSGEGTEITPTLWTQIMPQLPHWFDEQTWELPFYADYYVMQNVDKSDSTFVTLGKWTGEQPWSEVNLDTAFNMLDSTIGFTENKIPWDSLGNPQKIYILGYIASGEWAGELVGSIPNATRDVVGTYASWPAQSLEGGDGDKNADGKFNHWFSMHIEDGISPMLENDPPQTTAIDSQAINEGESFVTFDLDTCIYDDLTPDADIIWSFSGQLDLQVSIAMDHITTITIPNDQWNGSETITFIGTDQSGETASVSGTFSVSGDNQMPLAGNDTSETVEDTPLSLNLLLNDSDPDTLDNLKVDQVFASANSSVEITADSTILYTSNLNFFGDDTFEYVVTDQNGGRDTATVTVTVTPVNDPPQASADEARTNVNAAVTLDVMSNDSDPENDPITISDVWAAANGSVVNNSGDDVTYTPTTDFHGQDTFSYVISDDNGLLDTALVTVMVNDLPIAVEDQGSVNEDSVLVINLLLNDSDPNNDTLTVFSITDALHGTVQNNNDSTITYSPGLNYFGLDSLQYVVTDGYGGYDTAKVVLTINAVNDAPIALDDSVRTPLDSAVTILVLENDSDIENDPLTVTGVADPINGQSSINDGLSVTYTPNPGYSGEDTFIYIISDGDKADTASVFVLVNTNPVAVDDSISVQEDTPETFNVLLNDSDANNDPLSVASLSDPYHGTIEDVGSGNLTYSPELNFTGADSFYYGLSDGFGGLDTGMVYISVTDVNDNPVAVNDTTSLAEDVTTLLDVLANDSDPENNTLTISGYDQGAHGTVTSNGDTTLNYEPNANFFGADSFKYRISDGREGTDSAWVQLTVLSVNDAPEIRDLPNLITLNPTDSTKLKMMDYAYDVDTPDSLLVWTFEAADPAISYAYDAGSDSLTIYSHGILGEFNLFTTLTDDSSASDLDTIVVRVEEPSGLAYDLSSIPKEFMVSQNFPNPFNPTTQIVYGLPKMGDVNIEIFNIAGQRIFHKQLDNKPAGYHFLQVDGTRWSSGVYFYRVVTGKSIKVKKMMLMK